MKPWEVNKKQSNANKQGFILLLFVVSQQRLFLKYGVSQVREVKMKICEVIHTVS